MKNTPPKIQTFGEIFAEYDTSPLGRMNGTCHRLARDPAAQVELVTALSQMGQRRFVNLVSNPNQARTALALYSGDGIVTKITATDYLPKRTYPLVLFPFEEKIVAGSEHTGDFAIQRFPMAQVNPFQAANVTYMRAKLAEKQLVFIPQEDRAENTGDLAGRMLSVIDGDSVQLVPNANMKQLNHDVAAWRAQVIATYPKLYLPGEKPRQSPQTDFQIAPYRPQTVIPPTTPAPPPRRRWFFGWSQ